MLHPKVCIGVILSSFTERSKSYSLHWIKGVSYSCFTARHPRSLFGVECELALDHPAVAVGTPLQDVGRRLNEALDRYKKVKAEKRAGKDFQRRRKSLVLTILEYYIHLVQIGVAASNGDRKYIRRLNQAQETFRLAKEENKLPLRSEPILPRVEDDDDLESHCAESVYQPLSEDEQELEQRL